MTLALAFVLNLNAQLLPTTWDAQSERTLPRRVVQGFRILFEFAADRELRAMSSKLHSLFDIQPASVTNPEPTYQKSKGKAPQTLGDVGVLPDVELADFASRKTDDSRQASYAEHELPKGAQTPKTPNELEMSRPATPNREDAVGTIRTWNAQPMTKWRILCCCLIYFSNGINDSGELRH